MTPEAPEAGTTTRREFLKSTALAGLCLLVEDTFVFAGSEPQAFRPNAYIRIAPGEPIEFWVTRCEMGQGVRTLLPLLLAEELEVDPGTVALKQPVTLPEFKGIRLRTSGSGSASASWRPLRTAAATAREMLITAAASEWSVPREECLAKDGAVVHTPSGRTLAYGALASRAAAVPVPQDVRLKTANFRWIGGRHRRIDGRDLVTGRAVYGLDVKIPGMKYAVIAKPPCFGAKVKSWNADAAKRIAGVRGALPVTAGYAEGVAVIADSVWGALEARKALEVTWAKTEDASFSSEAHYQLLRKTLAGGDEAFLVRREAHPVANPSETFDASYEWPYQVHAPLEPMNCTAQVKEGRCEIWAPTQAPEEAQQKAAKLLGLPAEAVTVHVPLMGGGFGRRLFTDYVLEAVEIARTVNDPVQLFWTREDEMRYGHFNPASFNRYVVGLGPDRRPLSLSHRCATNDLSIYRPSTPPTAASYAEDWTPWGGYDNPYNFGDLTVDYHPLPSPVPTGPWRSVEYPGTVFGRESLIDELAHHAGADPFAYRLELLKPVETVSLRPDLKIDRARLVRTLEAARELSQWKEPLAKKAGVRRGRGMACNIYHGETHMVEVADVSVSGSGQVRVDRIICVVDLGQPLNVLGIEGQIESAVGWGLTATLKGGMEFRNGQSVASNFDGSPVLLISEAPEVIVHIVPSSAPPSGLGEQPVPLVAPAVANAVFAATGKRHRRLPIGSAETA